MKNIVFGKITNIAQDEKSNNLNILKINIGEKEVVAVTKARNYRQNDIVVVALPGAEVINPKDTNTTFKVEEREINGTTSECMLCSAVELGLFHTSVGILIVKDNSKLPGEEYDTSILEKHIHITSNTNVNSDPEAVDDFLNRGPVEIIGKDELREKMLSGRQLRAYIGYDVSGPNLHLGNGSTMMKLRDWQKLGHYTVVLIGDYTARVGDHSDKLEKRKRLDVDEIEKNKQLFEEQFGKLIDLENAEVRFNSEWLEPLTFNDVITLTSLFSVQQMIERENFALRLENNTTIGLEELMYPLMQGYDAYALDVDLQIGGTDQIFNMLSGRKIMKSFGRDPLAVITMPLIPGTDGRKMSKSWNNYVPMNASANDLYAGIMSSTDEVMADYFKLLTRVPMSEVEELLANLEAPDTNPMDIKKKLAFEVTTIYYDETSASEAAEHFEKTVQNKEMPEDIKEFSIQNLPDSELNENQIQFKSLLNLVGIAESNSDAKRLISSGAVEIDGEKITDPNQLIDVTKIEILKSGKRNWIKFIK
ncbi:tyrosine--tRNA ligase [Candidatus Dojkabacteria bacterium]|uniref:Tyrosine--tRNA ligase n=1 Tax=Candidatus Dojkabacteria bacterium TaxID=2099670 RepID=A0A955L5Q8_9BACT|nr:tyrosine--tRNA ligase [Candidatus Dojkabacteria bacterium]